MVDFILGNKEICICAFVIFIAIIQTFMRIIKYNSIDDVLSPVYSTLSTVLTIVIILCFYNNIDSIFENILAQFNKEIIMQNIYIHIALIMMSFCIIKLVFQIIFRVIIESCSSASFYIKRNKIKRLIYSVIIGTARGTILIILIYAIVSLFNISVNNSNGFMCFDDFKIYNTVEKALSKNNIKSITDGFTQKTENEVSTNNAESNDNKIVVYYNGITVNDGVKSNSKIKNKAQEITKYASTDREKAKKIYIWIGTNIKYDNQKAEKVVNNSDDIESGAIVTFNKRTGICFDYACLYSAMAKDIGLKTRIVVGEAYNGREYISHAWNQAFLADEDKWVNVDCTFYTGGNYFDNENFNIDHIHSDIIWEG